MKIKFLRVAALAVFIALTSCNKDDNASGNFEDANGNVAKKYIKKIQYTSTQDTSDNQTFTVNYDANGRVSNASDGMDTSVFVYDNDNLANVTGNNDNLVVEEMFNSPYDGYEAGEVLEYDSKGNPVKVRLFERDDFTNDITDEFIGELTYDNKPNPFFYTMEAAGIIKVLDQVELNFSMVPQASEIVKAKMLLPVNNLSKMVVKTTGGAVMSTIKSDYVYDNDGYPTSATFTQTTDGETYISTATYTYK